MIHSREKDLTMPVTCVRNEAYFGKSDIVNHRVLRCWLRSMREGYIVIIQ